MAENLEDLAYKKIKTAISKGYIKKGAQLKEILLSRELNISRATVKGAFKRLVHEGLAEYKLNKGVSVVNPSLEKIEETFQVRAHLEMMSTSLAAGKITSKDFKALYRLIREEDIIFKAGEVEKYYEINTKFHLKIAEKSGNQVLYDYVKEIIQKTTIYLVLFDPFYQTLTTKNISPAEHRKIVRYLENNDAENAGLEMKKHLGSSMGGINIESLLPDDYITV
ncbi:MAG: GntR family transcriptional regulator [Desulfobacterales bacterium]|nr:GntR family transcriptional regulator [Desulfobacterales bacterium]